MADERAKIQIVSTRVVIPLTRNVDSLFPGEAMITVRTGKLTV